MAQAAKNTTMLGYCACALAGTLWGTGFYFGKLALREMSVEHMVLCRFLFACLGILPAALTQRARLSGKEWLTLATAAALGIPIQFLLQFHGLQHTTVSHASLMVGTMPVLLAAAAALFARNPRRGEPSERLDRIGWLALVVSTLGAALIALGGDHGKAAAGKPTLSGDLLVVASLILALGWILLSKRLMRHHSPVLVTAYTILAGTAMLAAWVIPTAGPPPLARLTVTAWLALAAAGLLCTAATTFLWNWGIHHVPASRAGIFLNMEPALGSWLGVRLLGETLSPYALIGGALILAAALALTLHGQPNEPEIVLE